MAYARSRKHYRVAKKELEVPFESGLFITTEAKYKLIVVLIGMVLIVFIKGVLLGLLYGKSQH